MPPRSGQRWLDAAVLAGALDLPGFATTRAGCAAPGAVDSAAVGLGRPAEGYPGAGARHRRPGCCRAARRSRRPATTSKRSTGRTRPTPLGPTELGLAYRAEPRRDARGRGPRHEQTSWITERGVTACGLGTRSAPSPTSAEVTIYDEIGAYRHLGEGASWTRSARCPDEQPHHAADQQPRRLGVRRRCDPQRAEAPCPPA